MKDPPMDSEQDLTALNSLYNLSSGMKIPAQIPVKAAMKIMIAENSQKENELENALEKLNTEKDKYEVSLFDEVVYNKKLALSSLINSGNWKINQNAFFNFVTTNSTYNGFNSEIINLSESDRSLLFNYLSKLL